MAYKSAAKRRAYMRQWHQKNKKRRLPKLSAQARIRAQAARIFLRKAKSVPCADCHKKYPYYVMDCDHRPGTHKKANLSRLVTMGLPAIKRELEKCDIVCANCHRIRTQNRQRRCS